MQNSFQFIKLAPIGCGWRACRHTHSLHVSRRIHSPSGFHSRMSACLPAKKEDVQKPVSNAKQRPNDPARREMDPRRESALELIVEANSCRHFRPKNLHEQRHQWTASSILIPDSKWVRRYSCKSHESVMGGFLRSKAFWLRGRKDAPNL